METSTDGAAARGRRPIRVGIVDESELVVLGVGGMLQGHPDRATLNDGPGNGSRLADVVLCDPVNRSVDLERYLRQVLATTTARVLAFTWATDPETARRALAAGAHGWLSKMSSSGDLVDAIEAVHRGETVSESLALDGHDPSPSLSAREREVLGLICRGLSNKEIADELYVSVNSVKTYVRLIYQKIGVTRRAQAVAWGLVRHY
jgi:DNA-binding NarL/FixJ family response regulator